MFLNKIKKVFIKNKFQIDLQKIPKHIAIIMDGNGRWAQKRGMPRNMGHREGARTLKNVVAWCDKLGVKYLTVYAFSTENWKRPKAEVDALMELLHDYLKNADKELGGKNIRIKVIGSRDRLSDEIARQIDRVQMTTSQNTGLTLVIALNYGARSEISEAVRRIASKAVEGKIRVQDIDESFIEKYLFTAGIPDPDLIIRPSGEKRLSNFLLWQSAYSEFWYDDVLWPDFREEHLYKAIYDYQLRNRRFGSV